MAFSNLEHIGYVKPQRYIADKVFVQYFGWKWATTDDNNTELVEEFYIKTWQITCSHDKQHKMMTTRLDMKN